MKFLTLTEAAERYHRSTKTFRKYVVALGIPHVKLGRDMLFDPIKVDKFLECRFEPQEKLSQRKTVKSKPIERSEFAGVLG